VPPAPLAKVVDPLAPTSAELGRVDGDSRLHLPRGVIFRDSFATALRPLLAEHFTRGVSLARISFRTGDRRGATSIYELAASSIFIASPIVPASDHQASACGHASRGQVMRASIAPVRAGGGPQRHWKKLTVSLIRVSSRSAARSPRAARYRLQAFAPASMNS
jgi:hypothetical protein